MTQLDSALERAIRWRQPISLDSSALIAFLANEAPVASLIAQVLESQANLVLSAIAVSEALVRTAATGDRALLETIVESLRTTARIRIVPFGELELIETATLRAQTRLKLPDAAIVATARIVEAVAILGNDRVWKSKSLGIQYIHLDDVVREHEEETR